MKERIDQLVRWCSEQSSSEDCGYELRLVCGSSLSEAELQAIPQYPLSFPFETPTQYRSEDFVVPASYRLLLSFFGGFRVEYREKPSDGKEPKWRVWSLVELFRPGTCENAHCGVDPTLCDSWVTSETVLDDREIDLTRFISFANAGMDVEASRWCFLIGTSGEEPAIYLEDNDYECLTGHWADNGEWISEDTIPVFGSFAEWLEALVESVIRSDFEPDDTGELFSSIFQYPQKMAQDRSRS